MFEGLEVERGARNENRNQQRKHPPFAKSAKDGAPAKTGAGIGRTVEWYHSRGSAVNCGESQNANRERMSHPPMKPNLGRIIVVALAASIVLNLAMILASSWVDLGRPQLTPAGKVLDLLGQPGGVLGQW